jgi:hypothetical protein
VINDHQGISPLRFAPVEMTGNIAGGAKKDGEKQGERLCPQDKHGKRGERLRRRRIKTRLIVINDHQGISPRARSFLAGLVEMTSVEHRRRR